MKNIIYCCIMIFFSSNVIGQQFELKELNSIATNQILPGSYMKVDLCDVYQSHDFSASNPYTFLQVVKDEEGKFYHILYQTDFSGMVNYVGISNNLSEMFNCRASRFFCSCLKKTDSHMFDSIKTTDTINCILSQLNFCKN